MRLCFRLIGLLLLAGAFAALIVDGTRSVAAGVPTLLSLGDTIGKIVPDGVEKTHHAVMAKLPALWDPVLVSLLRVPTWILLGGIGLMLLALTRVRAPLIGYSRR